MSASEEKRPPRLVNLTGVAGARRMRRERAATGER